MQVTKFNGVSWPLRNARGGQSMHQGYRSCKTASFLELKVAFGFHYRFHTQASLGDVLHTSASWEAQSPGQQSGTLALFIQSLIKSHMLCHRTNSKTAKVIRHTGTTQRPAISTRSNADRSNLTKGNTHTGSNEPYKLNVTTGSLD